MKKEQIQETIQKLFEQECRGYALYAEAYNLLQAQIESIECEISTLEEKKEAVVTASELKDLLSSEKFNKLKEKFKSVNTDDFMKEVSNFLDTSNSDAEQIPQLLEKLYEQEKQLINLKQDKQEVLCKINTSIRYICDYVAENDMKLAVTREIVDVAYKVFVKYYEDTFNFERRRKIIDIENSELPEEFVRAYTANSSNWCCIKDEDNAQKWFEEEARKINF